MIFVERTKIDEFEKKCIVAIFLDTYQEYRLVKYIEEYQFLVRNNDNQIEKLYLFNSPQNKGEHCKVYQLRNMKSTNTIEYIKLSFEFIGEFKECTGNSFEYVRNNFWEKEWEQKYPQLFSHEIPEIPDEYGYLYKYKMNQEECEELYDKDSELINAKVPANAFCETIKNRKRWFQEFIDGKVTFSNPLKFNDPFDCDCEIPYGISFVNQLYLALDKKVTIDIIARALEELRRHSKKIDSIEINESFISYLLDLIKKIQVENEEDGYLVKPKKNALQIAEDLLTYKKYIRNMKDQVRVLCLSPHNSDILMWGYYGNSGFGLCCEYEYRTLFEDIRNSEQNAICIYGKVKYEDKKPIYSIKTASKFNGLWEYVVKCMFTKCKKWEHEDEYRIVLLKEDFPLDIYLVDAHVESYYLGCRNPENPLEDIYSFPADKEKHQLKKDKYKYELIE